MNAAIELLEKASQWHNEQKMMAEMDKKFGRHDWHDPIFYNETKHNEIKEAIKILKSK